MPCGGVELLRRKQEQLDLEADIAANVAKIKVLGDSTRSGVSRKLKVSGVIL